MPQAVKQNAREVSPGRSRDDIAGTFARAPQLARPFQTLMNPAPPFVQCSAETPHSLAGMAGGPSSRDAFISKKGCEANRDVSYC